MANPEFMFEPKKAASSDDSCVFFFHTPKTAGTSINYYFASRFGNHLTHAEALGGEISAELLNRYRFVSGHLSYSRIASMLNARWIKVISFREPFSQVASHLAWVRRLADPGEEERFSAHPERVQRLALEMKALDFSKAADISSLAQYLQSVKYNYFFNTQTIYLDSAKNLSRALHNLYQIELVGIAEESEEFFNLLDDEFFGDGETAATPRENVNEQRYGLDIENEATRVALLPFVEKDLVVYQEAKRVFRQQLAHYRQTPGGNIDGYVDGRAAGEISGWCRFKGSLRKVELELRKNRKVLARCRADHFREGLKQKKIHPTGRCAFTMHVDVDIDLAKCRVYVSGSDIEVPRIWDH